METAEQQFIELLKSGSPDAFTRLVRDYQHRVVNTCYGFLHNRPDAEDAAQQVFEKIWNSIGSFRGDAKISSWIYRIAVNVSMNIVKKRDSRNKLLGYLKLVGFKITLAEKAKDPVVELENKEKARILMEAIDRLPETQRVAFTLARFEKLSGKEIAEVMDKSLSAVEALQIRAKRSLSDYLADYYLEKAGKKEKDNGRKQ